MAQLNHNSSYALSIDGVTPIERLRVTRNFIDDRKAALMKSELAMLVSKDNLDEFLATPVDKRGKYFDRECELRSYDFEQASKLTEETRQELAYLAVQEAALMEAARPHWNPALTDNENYELNFAREQTVRLVDKAICEKISSDRLAADTIQAVMRNPFACQMLIDREILNAAILPILANSPVAETTATILIGAGDRFMLPKDYELMLSIYKQSNQPIAAVTNALLALEANKPQPDTQVENTSADVANSASTIVKFPAVGTAAAQPITHVEV